MSFSSAVIVSILFFCISVASASVIPQEKTEEIGNLKEFKVDIPETGTKSVEKISIDHEKDLGYLHVPAQDGLTEADYLYDFRSNISVRREKSKASCFLGPLPDDLPKPADLKTGLERESEAVSKHKAIVRKFWAISEEVDKTLLRQEVQDFCGQFPVFRLQEVDLSSAAAGFRNGVARARFARSIQRLSEVGFCHTSLGSLGTCSPERYLFSFKIHDRDGTWWLRDCKFSKEKKTIICEKCGQLPVSNIVCYTVRCP